MSSLIEKSEKLKRLTDELLKSSKLPKILSQYGQIKFVGSYAARLMMHGDIDIHILRNKAFSKKEILGIFNQIVASTKFNSYYIGDWNDSNVHPEFPYGYYIGLKVRYAEMRWKIDIWFVDFEEQEKFDKKNLDITKMALTKEQREAILLFKQYRQENNIKISGQEIYRMVLNQNITTLDDFKRQLTNYLLK